MQLIARTLVSCTRCGWVYMGQSSQMLLVRINNHCNEKANANDEDEYTPVGFILKHSMLSPNCCQKFLRVMVLAQEPNEEKRVQIATILVTIVKNTISESLKT